MHEHRSFGAFDTQAEGQRNSLQDQVDRLVGEGGGEPAGAERAVSTLEMDVDVVPPAEREHDVTQWLAVEGENAAGPRELARDVYFPSQRDAAVGIEPPQIPGCEHQSRTSVRSSLKRGGGP